MSLFHSTAIIDESSNIHSNAEIGPFCIIGPNVKIEENVNYYQMSLFRVILQ